jgi:Tyrosine phosphatase family
VIGCLRKLQGWSLASIFNEYDRYAQGKGESDLQVYPFYNVIDRQFIENFDKKFEFDILDKPAWMP